MPRQIRDVRLQTREARQKLAPEKEPYWREIRRGLHVGYYKGHETGTWWLREIRDGRRAKRRVGLADDHLPADGKAVYSFEQVLKVALGEERPTLSPGRDCTVEDALNDYWAYREAKSPALSVCHRQIEADHARGRGTAGAARRFAHHGRVGKVAQCTRRCDGRPRTA